MKQIAIITGASSGLGAELARLLGGEQLDEIWCIARRADRLQALQTRVKTTICPLPLDLTDPAAITALQARLAEEETRVAWLVNAAGFGKIGSYADVSVTDNMQMVDLNCRAPVAVTQTVLPFMAAGGHIVQVCSTAAFQPFSYLSVYAASKAFLLRYSRALAVELKPREISVTALCPYWIKDTEFIVTARKTGDSTAIHSFPFASRCADVAAAAVRAAKAGKAVCTPGPVCSVHRVAGKLFPDAFCLAVWEKIRKM